MNDWVKEKLYRIDELYPPQRIQKSKNRWTKLWREGRPADRYPFTYGHLTMNIQAAPPLPDNYENRLRNCLDEIIARGIGHDDYIPSIPTGANVNLFANMFGAKEIIVGDDRTSERILDKPEDIDSLQGPNMGPGTVAHNIFKYQEYVMEETQGRILIHSANMPGPSEIAGMLFGPEKGIYCAFDDPNRFHILLSRVTDAFITFAQRQSELVGNLLNRSNIWDWDWAPDDIGVACGSDSITLASPEFYEEFYKPYLVRIGKAFGHIMLHSCGNYPKHIKRLTYTPYVSGLNTTQMKIQETINAGFNKDIVLSAGGRTCYSTVEQIEEGFDFIKKNRLKAYLAAVCHWPRNWRDGVPVLPWNEDDLRRIRESEERILQAAAA
jgi:hypothetical protein